MAIKTADSHVYVALNLQSKHDSTYLSFGKSSRWVDDSNPPEEVEDVHRLEEVQGYKKVKRFSLARPLRNDEMEETLEYPIITYGNTRWALVPNEDAYEQEARWVYVEAEILADDYPPREYRQVGLHMGLTPRTGVTKPNLLPEDVQDTGVLIVYENREPQTRASGVYVLEQFVLKI